MKTATYTYQPETVQAFSKINKGTVAQQSHGRGLLYAEPLIVMLDSLLRYARAYEKRYGDKLNTDGFLGKPWLKAAKNVRVLLNGQGAVAMEKDYATDSFDGGTCEAIFWKAMEVAGFKEEDL